MYIGVTRSIGVKREGQCGHMGDEFGPRQSGIGKGERQEESNRKRERERERLNERKKDPLIRNQFNAEITHQSCDETCIQSGWENE